MKYDLDSYPQSLHVSRILNNHIFKILKKHLQLKGGEDVLEVGCNTGLLVKKVQEEGARACGIDINPSAINGAVTSNLHMMDAEDLQFPDYSFDRVYSLHTIEHVTNIQKVFKEMDRVLRPGGSIVLAYPIEPGILHGLFALKSAVFVYKNPFLARKIHLHSLNPRKIEELTNTMRLQHRESHFFDLFLPQYITVLDKPRGVV
jgi:ubiquinone/menaquinone biosynthesis C-methylase UbiE